MPGLKALRSPYLLLVLLPFILFAPALLTGRSLYWGTPLLQFVPWRSFAWQALLSGELPLWNPYSGMGAPLAANLQSALFYPPNWLGLGLAAVAGVEGVAWGNGLLVALHLAWAGLGMAWLVRRLGLSAFSQVAAGMAFALSGYLVGRAGFFSINASAAWLPWVVLYCTPAAPTSNPGWRGRDALKLALAIAMQILGGHAQTTWYTLLLAAVWTCAWGWRSGWRRAATAVLRLGVASLFGALIAAVQLLPTAEYMLQSQRSGGLEYQLATTYSYWPWRLLTLFAPDMFGSPVTGDYWGYGNYWEDHLYIGVLPLFLALGALLSLGRRRKEAVAALPERWLVALLAGLAVVAMLMALGDNIPLYPWLYANIPTFDFFQAPTRFSIIAEFSLALLAGLGAQAWRPPKGRGLYWTRLGTAGAFAITLGSGLAWAFLGAVSPTFIRALAKAGMWACASGVLALSMPFTLEGDLQESGASGGAALLRRGWKWLVLAFIAADLLVASWGLNPSRPLKDFLLPEVEITRLGAGVDGNRLYLPEEDEYALRYQRFFRFDTFALDEPGSRLSEVMLPNLNLLYRVPSANNYDPLLPARYNRFMAVLEQLGAAGEGDKLIKLLNLAGIGVVERKSESTAAGVSFVAVPGSQRLRWVPCARQVGSGEEALGSLVEAKFDLDAVVLLEGEPQGSPEKDCGNAAGSAPAPGAEIRIESERADRVSVRVEAPFDGWVVLADTWYPGWKAYVDGVKTEIRRANYLFRAVPLAAGEHQLVFVYQPASFYTGALLSMLGLVMMGFLWRKTRGE